MTMETVSLARIVKTLTPELYPFLKRKELESEIVLMNGIEALETEDAMEIIQYSIYEHQKSAQLQ